MGNGAKYDACKTLILHGDSFSQSICEADFCGCHLMSVKWSILVMGLIPFLVVKQENILVPPFY